MVNKGWVPHDLKDMKMHLYGTHSGTATGLLYRGDAKTKYSKPNEPLLPKYYRSDPYDCSVIAQLNNLDEASKFMLL